MFLAPRRAVSNRIYSMSLWFIASVFLALGAVIPIVGSREP
jgi:hypothetical protein